MNVLEISKLHDFYRDIDFGYIGTDIDTGKIYYFSNFDQCGLYSKHKLYEFNDENISFNLANSLKFSPYKTGFDKKLSHSFDIILEQCCDQHRKFNLEHHYPMDNLDDNFKKINLKFGFGEMMDNSINYDGIYNPLKNTIDVSISDYLWLTYNEEQKQKTRNNILKELGHVKATYKKVNSNSIYIKIGFCEYKINCTKETTYSGNTLYHPYDIKSFSNKELSYVFEEIFNEYECSLIDSNFHTRYKDILDRLVKIYDKELLLFRYKKD